MKKLIDKLSYILPLTVQLWHNLSPFILGVLAIDSLFKKKTFHLSYLIHSYAIYLIVVNLYLSIFNWDINRLMFIFKISPFILIPLILFSFKKKINEDLKYWKSFIIGSVLLSFFVVPQFILEKEIYVHRPYFGFFIALSVLWSFFFFQKKKKKIFLAIILFFVLALVIVVPRMAILNVLVISCYFAITSLTFKKNYYYLIGALLVVLLAGMTNYSMLKNRFYTTIENDPRIVIWECASEVISNKDFNPFFGHMSSEKSQEVLRETYYKHRHEKINYFWAYDANYNTHNQFLEYFISWGVVGLLLFVAPFLVLFIWGIKEKDPFSIFSVLILTSFCLVENPLVRSWTIVIYPLCFELIRYRLLTKQEISSKKINL